MTDTEGFTPAPFPTFPQAVVPIDSGVVTNLLIPTKKRRGPNKAKQAAPKKNKGGRPKKAVAETAPAASPAPTARRPKKARAIKVDLSLAMSALTGLTEDDAKFLTGVIHAMQPFSSAQRKRIVAALGKVFG